VQDARDYSGRFFREYSAAVAESLATIDPEEFAALVETLHRAYLDDRQVFVLGNGGSAATASHFACDLSKGTKPRDGHRFRAISLVDNVALLTAWSNDDSYASALVRMLSSLVCQGDVVVAISASGASPNVLNAVDLANARGAITIGLTSHRGAPLKDKVMKRLLVRLDEPDKLEDAHMLIAHASTALLRQIIAAGVSIDGSQPAPTCGTPPRTAGGGSRPK